MNENKQLSVIIPAYNVESYITECLKSILSSDEDILDRTEVVVVDDGSTDQSGTVADEFARSNPSIRVIHKKNAGVAAARNTGMDNASGRWLYFADSDDWLECGGIGVIFRETVQNPDADVLFMEAYENKGSKEKKWEHFYYDEDVVDAGRLTDLRCGILYAPFWNASKNTPMAALWDKAYRNDFLTENSIRFCEHLGVLDDMVFNYEVFSAVGKVACRKIKPYHYRRVTGSITNSYRADRVSQDMAVWEYLFALELWRGDDTDILQRAMMCRIVKSFSICCRLCFFHKKNKNKLKDKVAYVEQVMGSEPYQTAFRTVRLSDLEWKLKIVALAGRLRSGWGVYLLHAAWELLAEIV